MKIASLIHTRTFYADFNSDFLVRPDEFTVEDIKWARKNVLEATSYIDNLQGERWVIFENAKYRVAGVVGFIKSICSKCNLSEETYRNSSHLFYDEKGRLIYAFIGVVIDKDNAQDIGVLSLDYLYKTYYNKILPIWRRTYQDVILEAFEQVILEDRDNVYSDKCVKIGNKRYYEFNSNKDYELFSHLFNSMWDQNVSFCSNMNNYNLVKKSSFNIMTTSPSIIARLKKDYDEMNKTLRENIKELEDVEKEEPDKELEDKKKNSVILVPLLMILTIIIVVFLLVQIM